jgi:hypothetical protein
VHDDQYDQNGGNAYGPGQPGYEAQLKEYNAAFTAFFQLAKNGINKSNPFPGTCSGSQVPVIATTPRTSGRPTST